MGFTLKNILHNKAKTLLHLETDPGLGCTEPAAIGLSAAAAVALLRRRRSNRLRWPLIQTSTKTPWE